MDGKQIIETIQENDLMQFFFELETEYLTPDYSYETNDGDELETDEDVVNFLTVLGLNKYENKGGRYDTSEFWNVVYFPDYDIYLKISGWYDSYGNSDHSYEDIIEVKPKEITKTIYN